MSLINQALKKAQRERNNPSAPEPAASQRQPGEMRPTHAETHKSYQILTWMVGGGILITGIVAAVALGVVLLSPKPQAPKKKPAESMEVRISLPRPVESPVPVAPAPIHEPVGATPISEQPQVPQPLPVPIAQEQPTSPTPTAPVLTIPVVSTSVPTTEAVSEPIAKAQSSQPVVSKSVERAPKEVPLVEPSPENVPPIHEPVGAQSLPSPGTPPVPVPIAQEQPTSPTPTAPILATPAPSVADQPVAVAGDLAVPEPPPAPDAPLPGAEPNPKVLAFLESSRITGIKVAGVHSRVLMNNQVFRMDDIVQPETQLRIKEIAANEILFVDESGIQYRKQFRR